MDLKALDRTDRATSRLNAALRIYRETILPEAQNPERQILYWIEHSKDTLSDEFRCFAIVLGREVLGYLQYSYFREEHIFFFEYLCIQDTHRHGLVPSEAVRAIEDYLAQNYRADFTIVFEIAHQQDSFGNWLPDKPLLVYFRRLGFRKVEFPYRYPILQSYDGEKSYPADLMIRLPNRRKTVTASEMRTVLRCLYFKHYLRWDRPFLSPERFGEREKLINELYAREVAVIQDKDDFDTNGDDKRSGLERFGRKEPRIRTVLEEIFAPKLIRMFFLVSILVLAAHFLGNPFLFVPLVLSVAAFYCLLEDTDASRKLFALILSKMRIVRPRSS